MEKRKTIYYTDELRDEFSSAQLEPKKIDKNYVYVHTSLFKRFTHFFWYRIVAPIPALLYTKIAFRHKIVNAEVLRPYRSTGYFMYGNHTQDIGDALIPSMIEMCKDKYVIVNPANLSVPVIGPITPSLGALPLPDDRDAHRAFTNAIRTRIEEGSAVVIYPEAHIWPYYTGIRHFSDASFYYPIKHGVPVFCFTNTYRRYKSSNRPQIVTYVDGPFFPDESLPLKERRADLCRRVRITMLRRAENSNMKLIKYVKQQKGGSIE
ncbi:MAG: hypothetical protein IJW03_00140 [Clostridia bacterium]|nr:hypothetical protein [Clostridia bacterium]